jgi:hypothetical protein
MCYEYSGSSPVQDVDARDSSSLLHTRFLRRADEHVALSEAFPGLFSPENCICSKSLRNSEHVSLFNRGGLLSSLEAIDDGEYFVSASSRIAAHGVIVHLHYD